MRRILSLSILGALLLTLTAYPVFSQTAEEILKKMVEAQGGKKVFESVKDMTLSGNIEIIQQGMTGTLTVYKKEPDKRRTDIEVQGFVVTQAYDGQTAWGTNLQTFTTEVFSGEQAASLKRDSMPLVSNLYPEKYGISHTLKGKEKIENKDYFVLEESYPDGFKATLYIDPETYLTYKSKAKTVDATGTETEFEQLTSDYKKVDGMTIAHSIVTYANGQEYLKIIISKVGFNSGLDDSLFKMK
jgi:outer membrane lipoprotein-sorting protein